MDFKLLLVCNLVLFIVSCGWFMQEHGQYILWGSLLSSVFLFCFDYASEKLRGISLKETLERWMSNAIQGTGVTIQSCFLMLLGLIPILIHVYWSSLLFFGCPALLWWIFSFLWRHIQHKYLVNIHPWVMVNIHPWVMSVVNCIKKTCYDSFCAVCTVILAFICMLFCVATLHGFVSWIFVNVHRFNVEFSESMGVRDSTLHRDIMLKIDNFTCSNNNLVRAYCEVGILHTDLYGLTKNSDMTREPTMKVLIAGFWSFVIKLMQDAKHKIEMNEIELQIIVKAIIYLVPGLEYFQRPIQYVPYFLGLYRFARQTLYGITYVGMPYWIILYIWFLYIRYLEHGLFWAICHWNTCRNGICILVLRFIQSSYTLRLAKPEPASQEPERATSQPHATQTRSVRGESPGARRAS